MALSPSRHELGRDDEPAKNFARKIAKNFFAANPRTRPQAGRARYHAEVSMAAARPCAHRKRFDSRQSRALRRSERPAHALHLHASRLRLRLQILRERTRWLETQSYAR